MEKVDVVVTFGTFDLFHFGHLEIFRRCKILGKKLVVGVSSDKLNFSKKGHFPIICEKQRIEMIRSCQYVDEVFVEHDLKLKGQYLKEHNADLLIMGDDWKNTFDEFKSICKVAYLPRTKKISSTEIVWKIIKSFNNNELTK